MAVVIGEFTYIRLEAEGLEEPAIDLLLCTYCLRCHQRLTIHRYPPDQRRQPQWALITAEQDTETAYAHQRVCAPVPTPPLVRQES